MQDPKRERIAGVFHTVEDLMNLPEPNRVDPGKAREVSARRPVRFWMAAENLAILLKESIEHIRRNQEEVLEGGAEEDDCRTLIRQRELWLRHLATLDEEDVFLALYPASMAGTEYDDEEAITE